MYFHCSARTALFSTRRKFCEFSTGFSTLTKTSKRVTLPHYHHFVCKVLFQILYWKRSWEKFGSHTVRLQSAQNSEKTRSGENWKIIFLSYVYYISQRWNVFQQETDLQNFLHWWHRQPWYSWKSLPPFIQPTSLSLHFVLFFYTEDKEGQF